MRKSPWELNPNTEDLTEEELVLRYYILTRDFPSENVLKAEIERGGGNRLSALFRLVVIEMMERDPANNL